MGHADKSGERTVHMGDNQSVPVGDTLLPMLIGGLVLIVVGMIGVMMFV